MVGWIISKSEETRNTGIGRAFKIVRPLVNLVIRELLLERCGSLKIGVAVEEDWPKCAIVLPSLGYEVLKIYAPVRFRKFLQGGTLTEAEWLPPNQARRISNLQDSSFFVSGGTSLVR